MPTDRELQRVKSALLPMDAVTMVGDGGDRIVVSVSYDDPEVEHVARDASDSQVDITVTGPVRATALNPGGGMTVDQLGGHCTAGIPATKNGLPYLVTAYHCINGLEVGDEVTFNNGDVAGIVAKTPEITDSPASGITYNVDCDYGVIQLTNGSITRVIERLTKPLSGAVHTPSVGQTMVKSGETTGVAEGGVFVKNASTTATASISGYGEPVTVHNLTGSQMTVEPGDSGAPVMVERQSNYQPAGVVYGGVPGTSLFHAELNYVQAETGLRFDAQIPDPPTTEFRGELDGPGGSIGISPNLTFAAIGVVGLVGIFAYRERTGEIDVI